MTKEKFDILFAVQKEELIANYGTFIRTRLVGNYLCDIYLYDDFYIIFFYLYNQLDAINCQCLNSLDEMEHFLTSLIDIKIDAFAVK